MILSLDFFSVQRFCHLTFFPCFNFITWLFSVLMFHYLTFFPSYLTFFPPNLTFFPPYLTFFPQFFFITWLFFRFFLSFDFFSAWLFFTWLFFRFPSIRTPVIRPSSLQAPLCNKGTEKLGWMMGIYVTVLFKWRFLRCVFLQWVVWREVHHFS